MGGLLVESGRADEARRRFNQSLALVDQSGASPEIKQDARLRHRSNLARVAIRKRDLPGARTRADAFMEAAAAGGNPERIREGHELLGLISLAQRDAESAIGQLREADQQDPYVLYSLARAYDLKGDRAEAKGLYAKVSIYNELPTLRYAIVRRSARLEAAAT